MGITIPTGKDGRLVLTSLTAKKSGMGITIQTGKEAGLRVMAHASINAEWGFDRLSPNGFLGFHL
ncbi:hypothetical protein [Sphingobium sp.]|uniref:hypothetical protein n=1 Tax=Sphingobium sp. TaxID=1912891 RepID=UPI003B3B2641